MTNEPENEPGNLGRQCDMCPGMNKIKDPDEPWGSQEVIENE
jgi:hypothetical protein